MDDLCNVDSGYSTITDDDGVPHSVYLSVAADGSVWLRVGKDHAQLDWTYVEEPRVHFHTDILTADDIHVLKVFSHTLLKTAFTLERFIKKIINRLMINLIDLIND